MARGKLVVKLDVMTEKKQCLFTLAMATRLSFAYPVGKLFIVKIDAGDPEILLRYMAGERDQETGQTNIKLVEGDMVESEKKLYTINKVSRCPKERLVFVEATLMTQSNEKPPFFPVAA